MLAICLGACVEKAPKNSNDSSCQLIVLGNIQDGGSPHIGCKKKCCENLFLHPDVSRKVVCLGLIDHKIHTSWLFEATPDIGEQFKFLKEAVFANFKTENGLNKIPEGIFLTHAHIGHYSGLMYLGKEAMGAKGAQVYAMPRMKHFLEANGPWSQLVEQKNIILKILQADSQVRLSSQISILPFLVPHRDEYSETVGYKITGPTKKALFIPDINKWELWDRSIIEEIKSVDYAFLDATFFDGKELNTRDLSQIPHPFVVESLELFKNLVPEEKSKIYFLHFNHTNPLINPNSKERKLIEKLGFHVAGFGEKFSL